MKCTGYLLRCAYLCIHYVLSRVFIDTSVSTIGGTQVIFYEQFSWLIKQFLCNQLYILAGELIFTSRNEVGSRLCFYMCLWFCSQGVVSQHAGGIPACLAAGLPGVGGGIPACLAGFQAHTQGGSWGVWPGGSPGPHPRGKLRGLAWGGLQAHTPRGISRPTPWGGLQA